MQLLRDVQTDVSYNLDQSRVLLYPINGESITLSDRDMTCNDFTDHLNPVTLMDELGKEHPDMKYSFRDILVCMVLQMCIHPPHCGEMCLCGLHACSWHPFKLHPQ